MPVGWVKRAVRRMTQPVVDDIVREMETRRVFSGSDESEGTPARVGEIGAVDQGVQTLLSQMYRQNRDDKRTLPSFDDIQFRAYSQTGEDGLLLYVFSLLGTTNRRCVEICAGDGIECNTANLIINHGWEGLLFDGDERNVEAGRTFYGKHRDTFAWPPKFAKAWITAESVNDLIREQGFAGDIDLLSLDIDGNDYWIWKALDCVRPRVVILEYENAWGPDRSVTQRYQPDFVWRHTVDVLPECGASLAAFVKLGREKGYRLVGSNRLCFNAVFIRDDVGVDVLPEVPTSQCFGHALPQYRIRFLLEHERTKPLEGHWMQV